MRRFNYTGRRKIDRGATTIRFFPSPQGTLLMEFKLELKGGRSEFDGDSLVIIEARDGAAFERIELGTLSSLPDSLSKTIPLVEFASQQVPIVRLKVVNPDGTSLLAAHAKNLRPQGGAASLLHITVGQVDGEVFRVDVTVSESPILVLNDRLSPFAESGVKAIATDKVFQALVFPQVVRQVLTRYYLDECLAPDEEEESPPGKWIALATRLGEPLPEDSTNEGDIRVWIDRVVAAFAKANGLLESYGKVLTA